MKTKTKKAKRAVAQQPRAAAAAAVRHAPASAITFRQNVIYRDTTADKLVYLQAGSPSCWFDICDVPPALQGLIGSPEDTPPPRDTELQHWRPKELVDAEDEAFEELNAGVDDPDVREKLDERNREHLQATQSRNQTLAAVADRDDAAVDKVAAEIEEENSELYELPRTGKML